MTGLNNTQRVLYSFQDTCTVMLVEPRYLDRSQGKILSLVTLGTHNMHGVIIMHDIDIWRQ